MKKIILILILFLMVFSLHARAIREDFRNAEEKARLGYAFGMLIGYDLASFPLEFDYDAFTEGIRAVREGFPPQFSEMEAIEIVDTAYYSMMETINQEYRLQEMEFLMANAMRPEVQMTLSGLQYEVINETGGEKPEYNSTVLVNYYAYLPDGYIFDMSDEGGMYIPLEYVIPGWAEGLMLMGVGSEYILYIPSDLAYGSQGVQGFIPPYSTVIFMVELLEISNEDYFWY